MSRAGAVISGPPLHRHLAAAGVTVAIVFVFWSVHDQAVRSGDGSGLWNKVFADASVVLLCLVLMLGPLARFVPRLRRLVPWGRELGIAMFVTAALHVALIVPHLGESGWIENMFGSFSGEGAVEAANSVGWLAFVVVLVLVATSNDLSHRVLGRGWKFVQRQAYTLFVLTVMHSVVWLEWFNPDWVIPTEWFWSFSALVVFFQFAGFWHTVFATRGPSPQRAPSRQRPTRMGAYAGAGKWLAVVILWGGLTLGSYSLATADRVELSDDQISQFCARWEQTGRAGLEGYVPEEVRSGDVVADSVTIREMIESCEAR